MSTLRPDDQTIDQWIAGTLNSARAAEVERYFEENPEEDPALPLLKELDGEKEVVDGALLELISALKNHPLEREERGEPKPDLSFLKPVDDPTLLGELGTYQVLEVIACGGMAIILKGRDPVLDRLVALKVMTPGLAGNATARARFLREARAAAKLDHDNILPIYGIHSEPFPWYAMRYASGGSLQDLLDAREKLKSKIAGLDQLRELARQAASALQAAHEVGIVHRDIKPGNILFDRSLSKIWLCDFGIARSLDDPDLTYDGMVAGTPHYMSPEQAKGGRVDGRSDLFSLGSVLYHCATGQPPFQGNTSTDVLLKVAESYPVRATRMNASLPSWFERLLGNLLAKNPRDRFRDAGEVVAAIDSESAPIPKSVLRRRKFALAISGTLLAAVLLLQIPVVKKPVGKFLASVSGRKFLVEGSLIPNRSLRDAVERARSGDVILLPANGSIEVDQLEIPAGKSLTLRARDEGSRPVLVTRVTGASGIVSEGPLRLIGLDFVLNSKPDSDAILVLGGSTVIEDCRFRSEYPEDKYLNPLMARTIEIVNGGDFRFEDCRFDLTSTNLLTLRHFEDKERPLTVTIDSCDIEAVFVVDLRDVKTPGRKFSLTLNDSTFSGSCLIKTSGAGAAARTTVKATDCRFENSGPVAWFRTSSPDNVMKNFLWIERGCHYPPGRDRVFIGPTRLPGNAGSGPPLSSFKTARWFRHFPALFLPKP